MNANQPLKFALNIPVQKIYTALKWVVALNIIFLFGTWLRHSQVITWENRTFQISLAQFNLALENVAAAWYSSMLFFSTGIMALLCFWADMQRSENSKGRILNFGWIVMAGIFIMLSFDEMGSFHEMIGETAVFKKAGGSKGGGWYAFYALIAMVAIFMLTFFVMKFKGNKIALLLTIIGVLLFVSNPFQEKFEIHTWRSSPDPANWHRPAIFLLLEEGSEIFASFCFLYSFTRYAMDAAPGADPMMGKTLWLESTLAKTVIYYLAGLAFLLGLVMLVIHLNAWNFARDDNGIPNNWPPSATAFFAFVASIYCYFKFTNSAMRKIYLAFAFTCLVTSLYFGSNIYGYSAGLFGKLKYLLLALSLVSGLWAVMKLDNLYAKLLFACFVLGIGASVFSQRFLPSAFGYLAVVSLLLGLYFQFRQEAGKNLAVS